MAKSRENLQRNKKIKNEKEGDRWTKFAKKERNRGKETYTGAQRGGGEGTKQQTILIDAENRYF